MRRSARGGTGIHVSVFGKTDVGRTREHNEDCFLVADLTTKNASLQPEVREHELGPKGTLLVVADGMGGAAAGEVASEMATETIFAHLSSTWSTDEESTPQQFAYRMKEAVERANARIHEYAKQHPEMRGMGTTTTAVGILGDHVYLTQVGDSRAYIIRDGAASQLTKDQSLMQRLVDAGEITEEEAPSAASAGTSSSKRSAPIPRSGWTSPISRSVATTASCSAPTGSPARSRRKTSPRPSHSGTSRS